MKKAERIFNATRYECWKHIRTWGYEVNPNGTSVGFQGLFYKDTELICIRTINSITKILASKRRSIEMDSKLGISTKEKIERENQLLNMVETTLNNSRRNIEQFNEELKKIIAE